LPPSRAIERWPSLPSSSTSTPTKESGGILGGYATFNVIRDTERIDSDGTYDPWPPEAFELYFREVRADLHLPVYSALFTGQRKVDVLKMLRPALDASEMPLVAQKTSNSCRCKSIRNIAG
jgi:hypothetical protein